MTRAQQTAVTYNVSTVKDLIRFIRNLEARVSHCRANFACAFPHLPRPVRCWRR